MSARRASPRCLLFASPLVASGLVLASLTGAGLLGAPAASAAAADRPLAFLGVLDGRTDRSLLLADPTTGAQQELAGSAGASSPTWSPDARQIAWIAPETDGRAGHVVVADADGSGAPHTVDVPGGESTAVAWSATGDLFWLHRSARTDVDCSEPAAAPQLGLHVAARDGGPVERLVDVPQTARDLSVSPDGRTLSWRDSGADTPLCDAADDRIVLFDLATGTTRAVTGAPTSGGDTGWSPDGRHLVFSTGGDLVLVDVATATARLVDTPTATETSPEFSTDGTTIAVLRTTATGTDIALHRADGGFQRVVTTTATRDEELAWTPDGSALAVYGWHPVDDWSEANPWIRIQPLDGSAPARVSSAVSLTVPRMAFAPVVPDPPVVTGRSRGVR